ncbi:uncharacterized protein LOC128608277 [Ictalurus furcatus]|uniref:uncharacterized protein LOC128608277 n=1 Tax=Ictalurus furcatus TaxID=66913 RepID=UPI002350CD3A|nr:uncharacterized protein LOC128608277 [Ictalurus furcatus]
MVFSLKNTYIIAATFLLNIELCFCACARAEYEINGECCPMCAPGSRVYRHCTEFVSTTCVPCINSTFTTEPSGLLNCLSCAVCDTGQGIRVKIACTRTSDTICEPLEGFYCTHDDKGSCTQAVEHTKCSPGQYIKQKGTAHKDAECAGCKNGTYSDGSLEICKQHTKCEDLGLTQIKPGTTTSDVECGNKIQGALIAGIIVCIVVVVAVTLVILLKIRHKIGRCAARNAEPETRQTELKTPTSETSFLPKNRRFISTFTMISILQHTFIIAAIFFLNIELCFCACARAEYEINGECCPMCSPGNRVYRHCTEFTSTTCMQCVGSTFTDEPNGLPRCISCTVCDAAQGIGVKTACTPTSDTVCEPLDGFYCTDEYSGSCRYAVEHTKCHPGQYIKQKGTAVKDAECAACADGTYSNGSLQICKEHTKCEDLRLKEITPGTNSLDVECGRKPPVALIAGILTGILAVGAIVLVVAGGLIFKRRHKKGPPKAHTAEKMRFSNNKTCESDTSATLMREERKCAFNHSGHVASPVENDCGKQCCDLQEHEITHTGYGIT